MTDEPRQQRLDEQTMSTGIIPGAGEAWPPVPVEPESPAYVKEPLFSKKVLAGWAIGTLMVWFAITVIVPEIVRSVKAEIRSHIVPSGTNSPTETIYQTRRGMVKITRNENGVTIERIPPAGAPTSPPVIIRTPQADPAPPSPVAPAPAPTN